MSSLLAIYYNKIIFNNSGAPKHDIIKEKNKEELMLHIQEIRKNPDGLAFEKKLDLAEELKERNPEILDVQDIVASGKVQYEDGLYFLDYDLSYTITLTSSRSMEPVELKESYLVNEIFMEEGQAASQDMIDQDLVLPIENGEINVSESVADNILLNIPLKILTAEEEAGQGFLSGQDWQVMTEEEFAAAQEAQKEKNNPFAGLQGLFDE
ncbi:nucleic acid-binding protein [Streptococcus sanguinis SK355]|uniref:Nucleic acid-binding protein n=2 Tax=Streptococcus TaxID=1301 RepID=F3UQP5_STRSA|nr:nucleic acid-binding protein [Streptococcus sanguinis SK355]